MKVTLATHGGQAATINLRLPPEVLDTDALPESAAAEMTGLIEAAIAEGEERGESEDGPPGRARDAMSYTITVEDGGHSTVLTRSDTTMSPAFAALLTRLEQHFAEQ
jgi:hypothetical protein